MLAASAASFAPDQRVASWHVIAGKHASVAMPAIAEDSGETVGERLKPQDKICAPPLWQSSSAHELFVATHYRRRPMERRAAAAPLVGIVELLI